MKLEVKQMIDKVITVELTMTDNEFEVYQQLDTLLRRVYSFDNEELNEKVGDILSDFDLSYCDDVLCGDLNNLYECYDSIKKVVGEK